MGGRPRAIVFISLRDTPPAHQCVPLGPPWQTCQDPRTHHPTVSRGTSKAHGTQPGKARTALPALSVLAPGPLRVDRRHGAVGGWWLACCRRALGATWSCGGGGGRSSFSCVVCFVYVSLSSSLPRSSSSSSSSFCKTPHTVPKNPSSATDNLTHCSGWSYSADKLLGQGKETCKRGWAGVEQGRREGLVLCHYSCKMVALPS